MTLTELGPAPAAYLCAVTFLLGACMGSFLHCAAWRYAHHESVVRGRSKCPACGQTLGAADLVPILSWLLLRGRCRKCSAPIPARYVLAELFCALLFLSAPLRFGLTWRTPEHLVLYGALFYLSLTDLETMELPGAPMLIAAVSWAAFLPTYADPAGRLVRGLIGALAVPGALLLLSLGLDKLLGRESLGGGDVKLLALTGLYLGWDGDLLLLMLACVLGLALSALLGARGKPFPFGPALALAAWAVSLFGQAALDWYWALIPI